MFKKRLFIGVIFSLALAACDQATTTPTILPTQTLIPTPTEAPTPTAPLTTAPVVKLVTVDQLPSIPRDLLFLDRGNLVRWNHATRRFETLSDNVACYSISADRQTVVLESIRGGDVYEIVKLDLASGSKTSLIETGSP